jgi:hypothetical protein
LWAQQEHVDGACGKAHPRAAGVDRHPRTVAFSVPPDLLVRQKWTSVGERQLFPRPRGLEYLFAKPVCGSDPLSSAVEVQAAIGVPVPALGPVARTASGEKPVDVGLDVMGRNLKPEAAEVSERIVPTTEYHPEKVLLGQSEPKHFPAQIDHLCAPPVNGPLVYEAHPSAEDPAEIKGRSGAVCNAKAPGRRGGHRAAVVEAPALGGPGMNRDAVRNDHGLFHPFAACGRCYNLDAVAVGSASAAAAAHADSFLTMRQVQISRQP